MSTDNDTDHSVREKKITLNSPSRQSPILLSSNIESEEQFLESYFSFPLSINDKTSLIKKNLHRKVDGSDRKNIILISQTVSDYSKI
jgi:hypothetical protein